MPDSAPKLLRRALASNVAFSSISALIAVSMASVLASHLALSTEDLVGLGLQLGVFAALLAVLASRPRLDRPWILVAVVLVAVADAGWAAGSAVALAHGLAWTPMGWALVLLGATFTATLSSLQAIAVVSLWRSRSTMSEGESSRGVEGRGPLLRRTALLVVGL
jgi:hypothetical protein